jgi:hypothetical protein
LGWCAIECLASTIDPQNAHRSALALFDRLRLREPLASAFHALGIEGEESWRAAARVKVLLLARATSAQPKSAPIPPKTEAAPPSARSADKSDREVAGQTEPIPSPASAEPALSAKHEPAFPPSLWHDSDVRWLTGVHEAGGHDYLVKEPFEELLWWLQLPALLRLASKSEPDRPAAAAIAKVVEEAVATVVAAGYQADRLIAFDRRSRSKDASPSPPRESGRSNSESARPSAEKPSQQKITPPLEPVGSKKE